MNKKLISIRSIVFINLSLLLVFSGVPFQSSCLENGLARTPPMGWMSWERFRCNIDCKNDENNCISERLIMEMADRMAFEGYKSVGYEYVIIDDCWLARTRDKSGKLQADPDRFPNGIKTLAKYVHSRGLKFGIYEDYGNYTCGGYPGSLGHLKADADTFADWKVDYVKIDGCYSNSADYDIGYPEFGDYLNKTGRPMVYSCSWPVYQIYDGIRPNWTSIVNTCNLWRIDGDIDDSWSSIELIIDYIAVNQDTFVPLSGPGHYNDPDQLIIGDFGLSYEQSKCQMALWASMASPLLMSVDLRNIRPKYKHILQNKNIIKVDQDPLGIQGKRIYNKSQIEIWVRPISPVINNDYSYSVLLMNRRTDGTPIMFSFTSKQIGLTRKSGYKVTNLYSNKKYNIVSPEQNIKATINPTGCVFLRFNAYEV